MKIAGLSFGLYLLIMLAKGSMAIASQSEPTPMTCHEGPSSTQTTTCTARFFAPSTTP